MWVVHLMLTLAALYSVIIAGMYFAQTWLLFPTMFAGAARIQLPASTQRLEVWTPDGESLAGVRIPSRSDGRSRADAAWLRRERLERRSDGPHPACALSSSQCRHVPLPRLCAEQRLAERADAVLGLRHNLRPPPVNPGWRAHHSDRLQHRRCGRRISRPASTRYGNDPGHALRLARSRGS